TILDRAQATASSPLAVTTYHLRMSRQAPTKGEALLGEVWFAGADRQRSSYQTRDAAGAVLGGGEVVFNGPETWIAKTENGQTRVIHTVGTNWTRAADDPTQFAGLTDVLARYSGGKACTSAQLQGEASVAGRATHLIALTPSSGRCASNPGSGDVRVSPSGSGAQAFERERVTQIRVWVDKESFLPLKTEVRDATGAVLDRSEATSIEYNVPIPAATLT